jgi:parvulin-like peptidyl-prolyl isomerase
MRCVLLVLLILIGFSGGACAAQPQDETVRYVNGEVITFADVTTRYIDRIHDFERRKLVTPDSNNLAEKTQFMQDSLEELTDEDLMVQEAKLKKLVPDHDKVVKEILDLTQAGARSGLLTLADQAKAGKMREREESIEFLIDYFYDVRSPEVTPQQLFQTYQDHRQEYLKPARAHILAIVLLPSEAALINDVQRTAANIFKLAVDVSDPVLAKAASNRLDAYTDSKVTAEGQKALLDAGIKELAQAVDRTDLDAKSHSLAQQAVELQQREAGLHDLPQCLQTLQDLRGSLVGKGEDDFRAAARRVSQDAHASDGGDQGWIEPGQFPAAVDQRVYKLPPHAMSEVFEANQTAWLVYLLDSAPAHVQTFPEVVGILERELFRTRHEELKKQVATLLRKKASIRDVVPISQLTQ